MKTKNNSNREELAGYTISTASHDCFKRQGPQNEKSASPQNTASEEKCSGNRGETKRRVAATVSLHKHTIVVKSMSPSHHLDQENSPTLHILALPHAHFKSQPYGACNQRSENPGRHTHNNRHCTDCDIDSRCVVG